MILKQTAFLVALFFVVVALYVSMFPKKVPPEITESLDPDCSNGMGIITESKKSMYGNNGGTIIIKDSIIEGYDVGCAAVIIR